MNSTLHPNTLQTKADSYGKACFSLTYNSKPAAQEDECFSFSTIDGGVIAYNAGAKAIDNGAGIFIGEYFVGMSDSYQSISNLPFVRY